MQKKELYKAVQSYKILQNKNAKYNTREQLIGPVL